MTPEQVQIFLTRNKQQLEKGDAGVTKAYLHILERLMETIERMSKVTSSITLAERLQLTEEANSLLLQLCRGTHPAALCFYPPFLRISQREEELRDAIMSLLTTAQEPERNWLTETEEERTGESDTQGALDWLHGI